MPSSISSSELPVPDRPWLALALGAAVLATGGLVAWEATCRSWGYGPARDDIPDLWNRERDKVVRDSIVIIGSSRVLFDLDLDVLEKGLGKRPLQLALVGSTPRPVLADLAADPSFAGTLLVGVTPPLFFAPGGPPLERPTKALADRPNRGPARRWSFALFEHLDRHLAFLNGEDLALNPFLAELPWPVRPGTARPPRIPPYIGALDEDRRCRMTERLATDPAFQAFIQKIWQDLLGAAPPMEPAALVAIRDRQLAEIASQVAAIRARGGRVVFLRPPSTGWFRELEAKATPRAEYWDKLLAATGAPGIHFEDHPELSAFPCPEWSHLTYPDSVRFTEALVPRLRALLGP